jgi:hypothetical protein
MSTFPSSAFWLAQGSSRDLITFDEVAQLQTTNTLIQDERRRRTLWFDGRFLAAKDQTREQDYALTRFADLGRAGGMGVVSGLMVTHSAQATVTIDKGQGITPSGEQVLLPAAVTIDLTQIAEFQQLEVAFGLSRLPTDPPVNRSGLFILGLRPVEYTGNPVASYPTTVDGPRGVQDGDIIEAAAIVMVPYPDQGATTEILQRRSRVARTIFVENGALGVPENVLPLAMVAMDRGIIQWLDVFLVRREVGMEYGSVLGLGFAPRALREAHILQYLNQLSEVTTELNNSNRGQSFSASDYFEVLPPVGLLPTPSINPDFSQIYFPSQIQCDLTIIPDDELAALVEDGLSLTPIDLTAPGDELESSSILILVPVPRSDIPTFQAKLTTLTRSAPGVAPGVIFQRKPIDSLVALTALRIPPPVLNVVSPIDAAWKSALSRNAMLWYVRRRDFQLVKDGTPTVSDVQIVGEVWGVYDALSAMPGATPPATLNDRFTALRAKAKSEGITAMTDLFSGAAFAVSDKTNAAFPVAKVLVQGAIHEFEQLAALDFNGTKPVVGRFSDPNIGQGLAKFLALIPAANVAATNQALAESGAVPEADLLGQKLVSPDLTTLVGLVVTIVKTGAVDISAQIGKLLRARPEVASLEITS